MRAVITPSKGALTTRYDSTLRMELADWRSAPAASENERSRAAAADSEASTSATRARSAATFFWATSRSFWATTPGVVLAAWRRS